MWAWFRGLLDRECYVVAWRFTWPHGGIYESNTAKEGDTPMTRFVAERVASGMCDKYGAGPHWVERIQH